MSVAIGYFLFFFCLMPDYAFWWKADKTMYFFGLSVICLMICGIYKLLYVACLKEVNWGSAVFSPDGKLIREFHNRDWLWANDPVFGGGSNKLFSTRSQLISVGWNRALLTHKGFFSFSALVKTPEGLEGNRRLFIATGGEVRQHVQHWLIDFVAASSGQLVDLTDSTSKDEQGRFNVRLYNYLKKTRFSELGLELVQANFSLS